MWSTKENYREGDTYNSKDLISEIHKELLWYKKKKPKEPVEMGRRLEEAENDHKIR